MNTVSSIFVGIGSWFVVTALLAFAASRLVRALNRHPPGVPAGAHWAHVVSGPAPTAVQRPASVAPLEPVGVDVPVSLGKVVSDDALLDRVATAPLPGNLLIEVVMPHPRTPEP